MRVCGGPKLRRQQGVQQGSGDKQLMRHMLQRGGVAEAVDPVGLEVVEATYRNIVREAAHCLRKGFPLLNHPWCEGSTKGLVSFGEGQC